MKRKAPIKRTAPLPGRTSPIARSKPTKRGDKKTGVSEKILWKWFSVFIRLRDSDEQGICKCFTCNRRGYWRNMDCCHGIPRQHVSTKYNEKNNHAGCAVCNGFEGGMREVYKAEMDRRYGPGTWDLMLTTSKKVSRLSQFEVNAFAVHYEREARVLAEKKGIAL